MPERPEPKHPSGLLSIVIPAYNEVATLGSVLERLTTIEFPTATEVVVVNDASTDGTRELLDDFKRQGLVDTLEHHSENQGKGAALRTGISAAQGDWVVIQDADLEYDPQEIPLLLAPVLDGRADVVYGSRFAAGSSRRVLRFWHTQANQLLTLLSNMFTNLRLTDMETCYKLFRRDLLDNVVLEERRFGIEPELTARFARMPDVRIYEVAISYDSRTYEEGKKIGWRDAISAVRCIFRYNLWARHSTETPPVANGTTATDESGAQQIESSSTDPDSTDPDNIDQKARPIHKP